MKTPGHSVLQTLFLRFVKAADAKLNAYLYLHLDRDVDFSLPIRKGQDPHFDRILQSLGSASKHCPKLMIDSVMMWRKSKSDGSPGGTDAMKSLGPLYPHLSKKEIEEILRTRRSCLSNFVLCRVLIEIVAKLTKDTLPDDLGEKLEEMVFGQLRIADPNLISRSVIRRANLDFFAEFLGTLSGLRFTTVSDRFLSELAKNGATSNSAAAAMQPARTATSISIDQGHANASSSAASSPQAGMGGSGTITKAMEAKLEMLIRCMRFLKLKIFPMEILEETADFLQILAEFYQNTHNMSVKVKHAFADVLVELLEPIAGIATAEVNLPAWMKTVELIYSRAQKMLAKPRHITATLPLITTLLCVSRKDFYLRHFQSTVDICVQQCRDKNVRRTPALVSLTRLLWVYLFRNGEAHAAPAIRRIDSIVRVLFPPMNPGYGTRRRDVGSALSATLVPPDADLDLFVRVVYNICIRFLEYGLENVMLGQLLGIDAGGGYPGAPLSPEDGSGHFPSYSGQTISGSAMSRSYPTHGSASGANYVMTPMTALTAPIPGTPGILASIGSNSSVVPNSQGYSTHQPLQAAIGDGWIHPERVIIALKVFILLLADVEDAVITTSPGGNLTTAGFGPGTITGTAIGTTSTAASSMVVVEGKLQIPPPPFPVRSLHFEGGMEYIQRLRERKPSNTQSVDSADLEKLNSFVSDTFFQRMGKTVRDAFEKINETMGKVAIFLDSTCKSQIFHIDGIFLKETGDVHLHRVSHIVRNQSAVQADSSQQHHGSSSSQGPRNENQTAFDLIKSFLDSIPRLYPKGFNHVKLIEMLGCLSLHADQSVRSASIKAVLRLADMSMKWKRNSVLPTYWSGLELDFVSIAQTWIDTINRLYSEHFSEFCRIGTQSSLNVFEHIDNNYLVPVMTAYANLLDQLIYQHVEANNPTQTTIIIQQAEVQAAITISSSSPLLRAVGVRLLQLGEKFHQRLPSKGSDKSLHDILQSASSDLIRNHLYDPFLGVTSTRSDRFHQSKDANIQTKTDSLYEIARSETAVDKAIWVRCFPDLCRLVSNSSRHQVVLQCLHLMQTRNININPFIIKLSESSKLSKDVSGAGKARTTPNIISSSKGSPSLEIIEVWRNSLTFVCASLEFAEIESTLGDKSTTRQLFESVLPLLSCDQPVIRLSIIVALGSLSKKILPIFLHEIQSYTKIAQADLKALSLMKDSRRPIQISSTNNGSLSVALSPSYSVSFFTRSGNPAQPKHVMHLPTALANIFSLLAADIIESLFSSAEHNTKGHQATFLIAEFIKDLSSFLSSIEASYDSDYLMLKYNFCNLVEHFYGSLVNNLGIMLNFVRQTGDRVIGGRSRKIVHQSTSQPRNSLTAEGYFPFEMRRAIFVLLEQWCGFGKQAQRFRENQVSLINLLLENTKDIREHSTFLEIFETQSRAIQYAALKAMTILCKGPISQVQQGANSPPTSFSSSFSIFSLLDWILSLFSSTEDILLGIAHTALEALLTFNFENRQLISDVISCCYVGHTQRAVDYPLALNISENCFIALVEILEVAIASHTADDDHERSSTHYSFPFQFEPHKLICLALFKAGHSNINIRRSAVILLQIVEQMFKRVTNQFAGSNEPEYMLGYESTAILSDLPTIFKYAQANMSLRLAHEKVELTHEVICEITSRVIMFDADSKSIELTSNRSSSIHDLLLLVLPWIRNIELQFSNTTAASKLNDPTSATVGISLNSEVLLNNLLFLSILYGNIFVSDIENIWIQLIEGVDDRNKKRAISQSSGPDIYESTLSVVIEYMLKVGLTKRNPDFVAHAKKIIVYLSRTPACFSLVAAILSRISPKSLVPIRDSPSQLQENHQFFVADINQLLMDFPERPPFSRGQLACVFLVDIAIEVGHTVLRPHLPALLHLIFVQLDHFITIICEENKTLLLNLLQSIGSSESAVNKRKLQLLITKLYQKEGRRLWPYEDLHPKKTNELVSEKSIEVFVYEVVAIFSFVEPEIVQLWGEIALTWGVSCPVRHVACRSLQIFRILKPAFHQQMLGELLFRLSNTICDSVEEIQGYALEILSTLHSMLDSLEDGRVLLFPQLFWAGVACLESTHEWEYCQGLKLLGKLLQKVDLTHRPSQNVMSVNFPTKWAGNFEGIQSLLLRGMTSSHSVTAALEIINYLLVLEDNNLVDKDPNARVLFAVLANLPIMLQGFEQEPLADGGADAQLTLDGCTDTANRLASCCERHGFNNLSRVWISYAKRRFRSKDDFLRQIALIVSDEFFPKYEEPFLKFVTSLLPQHIPFIRKKALRILRVFLPMIVAEHPLQYFSRSINVEDELLAPIIALLQTDLCDEALEVIDCALRGSIEVGETNLKLVTGGRSINKISRDTGEGSIHLLDVLESGWKVLNSSNSSQATRSNIHGVALTCSGSYLYFFDESENSQVVKDNQTTKIDPESKLTGGPKNGPVSFDPNILNILNSLDNFFSKELELASKLDLDKSTHEKSSRTSPKDDKQDVSSTSHTQTYAGDSDPSSPDIIHDLYGVDSASGYSKMIHGRQLSTTSIIETSAVSSSESDILVLKVKQNILENNLEQDNEENANVAPSLQGLVGKSNPMSIDRASLRRSLHTIPVVLSNPTTPSGFRMRQSSLLVPSNLPEDLEDHSDLMPSQSINLKTQPLEGSNNAESVVLEQVPTFALSPSLKLLLFPNAIPRITFRIKIHYQELVGDSEFESWLLTDVSLALKIDKRHLLLEKIEPDSSVSAFHGSISGSGSGSSNGSGQSERLEAMSRPKVPGPPSSSSMSSGGRSIGPSLSNRASLVTMQILPFKTLPPNVKSPPGQTLNVHMISMAYAEKLAAIISDFETEESTQFFQGVVTWNVDRLWKPEITIGLNGIIVPYVREGLRFILGDNASKNEETYPVPSEKPLPNTPYQDTHSKRAKQSSENSRFAPHLVESQSIRSRLGPDAKGKRAPPPPPPISIDFSSAIEIFRIFPAAFELTVQLYEDWLTVFGDYLRKQALGLEESTGELSAHDEQLLLSYNTILQLRGGQDTPCYWPPLLGEGNESILREIAERLVTYQRVDSDYLHPFLENRAKLLATVNLYVSQYFSVRHNLTQFLGQEIINAEETKLFVKIGLELALAFLTLYYSVLALEGLIEEFVGIQKDPRMEESASVEKSFIVCQDALQSVQELV
ncbi:cell morphogenesis N-terminal-domain-containing protein [Cladochytrium replicatum]|nr:cell morphogenesis N-terminal-domain-containing protein [Cladochytrium replicatum]